jgi:hypothetical protein
VSRAFTARLDFSNQCAVRRLDLLESADIDRITFFLGPPGGAKGTSSTPSVAEDEINIEYASPPPGASERDFSVEANP